MKRVWGIVAVICAFLCTINTHGQHAPKRQKVRPKFQNSASKFTANKRISSNTNTTNHLRRKSRLKADPFLQEDRKEHKDVLHSYSMATTALRSKFNTKNHNFEEKKGGISNSGRSLTYAQVAAMNLNGNRSKVLRKKETKKTSSL